MGDFKFFKGLEPLVWRTAMMECIPVKELSGEHISNIIMCIANEHIPNPYLGKTNNQWLDIFENEMNRRFNKN